MPSRPPATPLHAQLRSVHARVRRALVLRHALRASAATCVLLAFAVTAGLALPRTPGTAWVRLALFAVGGLASLVLAASAVARETPGWDHWLESLEARFSDLRSWLRNALDLEAASAEHTSSELAGALRGEAAHPLHATPLGSTLPSLAARTPAIAASAVRVGGLTSPRYHIALAGEPRPVSFASTITAPAYARLPLQAVSGTRGDLAALAGSRATVEVTFDRDLEFLTASVNQGPAMSWSELTPRRWRGSVA